MNDATRTGTVVWIVLALAAGGGLGGWYGSSRSAGPPDVPGAAAPAGPPEALVTLEPLTRREIRETLVAYGPVVASPGESDTFTVPFESRVNRLLVAEGQAVAKDAPLIQVEPSADAALDLSQTRAARDAAKRERDLVEERVGMKLATRQDLVQAEQSLADVQRRLTSLEDRGIDGPRVLRASAAGVVGQIVVEPGQIVPAGDLLLTTIGEEKISVRLGFESEDVGHLGAGQPVRLEPVGGPAGTVHAGALRLVTRRVNPDTRLVDVYVSPAAGTRLLLGEWMRAEVVVASADVLAVPRAAVRPDHDRTILFTVEGGRAVRHEVDVGLESSSEVEVRGPGLAEGASVVVSGGAELEDGMAVRTGPGPAR